MATRPPRILHLSTRYADGGAARAATRIHEALAGSGVDSRLRVLLDNDQTAPGLTSGWPTRTLSERIMHRLDRLRARKPDPDWRGSNSDYHSFGQDSAGLLPELRRDDHDIAHLHWITGMLSIRDIARLRCPLVWTLHDMWAFCGGEHVTPDTPDARFRQGYRRDLNRQAWLAKQAAWADTDMTIVCPSHWLADCARASVLLRDRPVHVIPLPLDTERTWAPLPQQDARRALNLPAERPLILFGADNMSLHNKGADLLLAALEHLQARGRRDVELVIFGQAQHEPDWPCAVHQLGRLHDDHRLRLAYAAADVMVVPSRQEAFGQTASEAQACGTPVVAFATSGLRDIVRHEETGWLAAPEDCAGLADGIAWVLADAERRQRLAQNARAQAVARFSQAHVAAQYAQLYGQIMARPR